MISPSTSPAAAVAVPVALAVPVAAAAAPAKPKSKPRKRVNTAEKRHQHNAIERARRETLNSKFLSLAGLLPSLASTRRPSKSAIVNGSIAHLSLQRNQRLTATRLLKQLVAERDELFRECNEWRKASGYTPKEGSPTSWTAEMDEIADVEKETFGNFASFGEDDDDVDVESEQSAPLDGSMNLEQAAAIACSFVTPRSSVDAAAPAVAPASAPAWAELAAFLPESFSVPSVPTALSVDSPLGSQNPMLTPHSVDAYAHTPSPRSSASPEEPAVPAFDVFAFKHQVEQQQLQRRQQQAMLAAQHAATNNYFMGLVPPPPAVGHSDALAQIMATMFPQQRDLFQAPPPPPTAADQWAKLGLGSLLPDLNVQADVQPSLDELKNAVRTGMGLGLGMASAWHEQPVEGY
ncbi:hypothetical protein Q5752_000311 [Cryptotrichosporon argae]